MKRTLALLATLLILAPAAEGAPGAERSASNAEKREERRQERLRDNEVVRALIYYDRAPAAADDGLLDLMDAPRFRHFRKLPVRAVKVKRKKLEKILELPGVRMVMEDRPINLMSIASREAASEPYYGTVNDAYTGSGVGVAVIDSGVAPHADLPEFKQYSFINGNYPTPALLNGELAPWDTSDEPPTDPWGHGTHVAGIIVGNGSGSNGDYRGIAPDARLISLRVLDDNGQGSASDLVAALDWVLAYKDVFDIDVVNMSLGMSVLQPAASDPLVQAAEAVWDAGIVVLAAAGNLGWNGNYTIHSPGNSRKIITVGSLTDSGTGTDFSDDYVSTFSSRGPTGFDLFLKPDLVAPGNRVVATIPDVAGLRTILAARVKPCVPLLACTDDYLEMSGTSMATPMTAGAVARMLEKDPALNPATIKARLMRSARKLKGEAVATGAGLLDIDAALYETGTVTSAPSPQFVANADGSVELEDVGTLWGSDTFDATAVFSGDALGTPTSSGFIWSNGFVWSDAFVWSDGFVWSDAFIWTDGKTKAASFLEPNDDGSYTLLDD